MSSFTEATTDVPNVTVADGVLTAPSASLRRRLSPSASSANMPPRRSREHCQARWLVFSRDSTFSVIV